MTATREQTFTALDAPDPILVRLSARIDDMWRRYEQTGEPRWLNAASTADRLYLRRKEQLR